MTTTEFIHKTVYDGAINRDVDMHIAYKHALDAVDKYKKNIFESSVDLVNECIVNAVKEHGKK